MNLPDLQQKAINYLGGFFTDHEKLPTCFFGADKEDRLHFLLASGWAAQKEFCQLFLRSYFLVKEIQAYAFASEAWITDHHSETGTMPQNIPMPSEDPRRREVLICGATDGSRHLHRVFPIRRDRHSRPSIGMEEGKLSLDTDRDGHAGVSGVLYELLPDPAMMPNLDLRGIGQILEFSLRQPLPSIPIIRVLAPVEYEAQRN